MTHDLEIREGTAADEAGLARLYPAAFPEEELLPLVRELLAQPSGVMSLVAVRGDFLAGHVLFTLGQVADASGDVGLLGPLCVSPALQRQGIGGRLVRVGLDRLRATGVAAVYVLGDPGYYGRLGFREEARVSAPYELPPEWKTAWQSRALTEEAQDLAGALRLPPPWQHPSFWLP